eukprot:Gregarina_sp_Poly_1__7544@NODE_421_length_8662_cov_273_710646_g343_i0_p4_GENE_NODE_421_length_8662_cov_273_710646_g343_i0NODE_421_length_8662_cov_273_710646_g343_i0_p4_ORF_typecomplete_len188_score19_80Ribosomal_L18A/PF01775_17/6_6e47DUF1062/PF06353_12/0_05_NODE_421_length_8662_cov_273_710646_g343_i079988561
MAKTTMADASMQMRMNQYLVTGRLTPTENNPEPPVFRMKVFARDEIVAKSRFWYFMKKLQRVKKANGQVLDVTVVREKRCNKVKNYAIWLRYDSRTGTHNMYKEFRDISQEGAISQMYAEMAGRHRAAGCSIQVIKCQAIHARQCRRAHMTQLHERDLKFPHIARLPMAPKSLKSTFVAKRTKTFFN